MTTEAEESVAADVQVLKAQVQSIADSVSSLATQLSAFQRTVSDSRQFKWPVALAAVSAAAVIFAAISNDASKNTEIAAKNLEIKLLQSWAPIAAKADISEKDRADLHIDISKLKEITSTNASAISVFSRDLVEVETQFKASDEFRNVNLAEQMRINSMLWQHTFGTPFPAETYYPSIAKPR